MESERQRRTTIVQRCVNSIRPRESLKKNKSFPKEFRHILNSEEPCLAVMTRFPKNLLPLLVKALRIFPEDQDAEDQEDDVFVLSTYNGPRLNQPLNNAGDHNPDEIEVIDISEEESDDSEVAMVSRFNSARVEWLGDLISKAKDARLADKFIMHLNAEEETVICLDEGESNCPESSTDDSNQMTPEKKEKAVKPAGRRVQFHDEEQPDSTEEEQIIPTNVQENIVSETEKKVPENDPESQPESSSSETHSNAEPTVKILNFSEIENSAMYSSPMLDQRNQIQMQSPLEIAVPHVVNCLPNPSQTHISQHDLNVALNSPIIFSMNSEDPIPYTSSVLPPIKSILDTRRRSEYKDSPLNRMISPKKVTFSPMLPDISDRERELRQNVEIIIQPIAEDYTADSTSGKKKTVTCLKVMPPQQDAEFTLPSKGARIRVPKVMFKETDSNVINAAVNQYQPMEHPVDGSEYLMYTD